ncbi:MAG: hypothetical protein V4569_16960 [Pseudomonadota bacterium]
MSTPVDQYAVPAAVLFPANANDAVWDEQRQVLYLSLPSSAGPSGNAIVALDPRTNSVLRTQYAGSEPTELSLSDDGQYLYAGIYGSASVQRFRLPDLAPDLNIPLGRDQAGGPYHAVDLAAVPGFPRAVVVASSVDGAVDLVSSTVVYDDDLARPQSLSVRDCTCASLQWGESGAQLYAADNQTTGFSFYDILVGPTGLSVNRAVLGAFTAFGSQIHYSRATRLIYADEGTVFNPATASRAATVSSRGPMVADPARNRLYFATAVGRYAITGVDATTYQPVGLARPLVDTSGLPSHMVRWGTEGLALVSAGGPVHLFGGAGTSAFSSSIPVGTASQMLIPGSINSLVFDPIHGRLYASVSSASSTSPNSILVIDPATGSVVATRFIGSEPNAMTVSDDGQYLYVGVDGAGAVQRLRLPSLELDLNLDLGSHPQFGRYVAGNLKAAPGSPRTLAVSRLSPNIFPTEQGGMQVFDDAVPRPLVAPMLDPFSGQPRYYNDVDWNTDGSKLFSTSVYGALYTLAVDTAGPRIERTLAGAFASPGHLHFDRINGLLYHDSGRAMDPVSGRPTGRFRPGGYNGSEQVVSDASTSRVFVLSLSLANSGPNLRIDMFDMSRHTPLRTYPVTVQTGLPFSFVKAGANRFAFRSVDGVYVVTVSLPS